MTNAQETNVKQEPLSEQAFLDTLINLCDDLAWGRPASEDRLFALTKEGAGPKNYVRLAEAFGMMLVKVESREYHRSQLIADLKTRNAELEEAHRLLAERNTHLMRTIQENYQTKKIVGQCEAMRKVIQLALTIARRPINTLILGPTGAGKEVIAKAIHFNSPRREGPFVAVNCTAIPDSLFESEMFGIEKGIATGVNARKGLIEEASGGTLFLDLAQSGQAAPGFGGARSPARGQFQTRERGHQAHRRHQCQSGRSRPQGQVSGRSLLPHQCGGNQGSSPARSRR